MQETQSLCCGLKNSGESHSDYCHDQTGFPPRRPPLEAQYAGVGGVGGG